MVPRIGIQKPVPVAVTAVGVIRRYGTLVGGYAHYTNQRLARYNVAYRNMTVHNALGPDLLHSNRLHLRATICSGIIMRLNHRFD